MMCIFTPQERRGSQWQQMGVGQPPMGGMPGVSGVPAGHPGGPPGTIAGPPPPHMAPPPGAHLVQSPPTSTHQQMPRMPGAQPPHLGGGGGVRMPTQARQEYDMYMQSRIRMMGGPRPGPPPNIVPGGGVSHTRLLGDSIMRRVCYSVVVLIVCVLGLHGVPTL